jgi:serine/threonine protein kinase
MNPLARSIEAQPEESQVRPKSGGARSQSSRNVLGSLISATRSWFSRKATDGTATPRVGHYELECKIGEGGMGVVYRARDARDGRLSAVKLQKAEGASAAARARFEREVRFTSSLVHENTVSVRDHGETAEGVPYYAMELLEGATLEEVVERSGPMPAARVVHVLSGVALALAEVHRRGFVHRDIKPSNVFLCQTTAQAEQVKVLDFGLVKDLSDAESEAAESGKVFGTPQYLAPESIAAPEAVSAKTDLYAVGALAYFLLTGEAPFSGDSVVEVCCHHLHTPVLSPSLRAPGPLPTELEALVLACLEKDPKRRPPNATDVYERLTNLRLAAAA